MLRILIALLLLFAIQVLAADPSKDMVDVPITRSDKVVGYACFRVGVGDLKQLPAQRQHFGLSPPHQHPRTIESIVLELGSGGKFSLPQEAFNDLFNARLRSNPMPFVSMDTVLKMVVDGGDGEKWYRATFSLDPTHGTLTRRVLKLAQGEWLSEWQLNRETEQWTAKKSLTFTAQ